MARLFESDSKEELQATASTFGGCFALTFVFLIPIAGFIKSSSLGLATYLSNDANRSNRIC